MKTCCLSFILLFSLTGCNKSTAPLMAYEPLHISEQGVGFSSELFFVERNEYGKTLNYQSRAGTVNVLESVLESPESSGYVKIEMAYRFGDKYLLIVSTGENGNSCPATTYAFTYDSKIENVTGKTVIDGCSELVEYLSDGNKLTVKKNGEPSVFYNGEVKV